MFGGEFDHLLSLSGFRKRQARRKGAMSGLEFLDAAFGLIHRHSVFLFGNFEACRGKSVSIDIIDGRCPIVFLEFSQWARAVCSSFSTAFRAG